MGSTVFKRFNSGGGGSAGTYASLPDKPKINDTTLSGNKSASDLGLASSADLEGKQDAISDLSTIRSGAEAGATAYQKPQTGIPSTDLASDVQTSLGKADSAYQKPSGGIPSSDMTTAVQTTLGKVTELESNQGDITDLETTATDLVGAINEVYGMVSSLVDGNEIAY